MCRHPKQKKNTLRVQILSLLARPISVLGKILFHRVGIISGLLLLQMVSYVMAFAFFRSSVLYDRIYWLLVFLSWALIIWIIGGRSDPGYQMGWIMVVMLLMPFGVVAYGLLGGNRLSHCHQKRLWQAGLQIRSQLGVLCDRAGTLVETVGEDGVCMARYLEKAAFCPVFSGTSVQYYSTGELFHPALLDTLRGAREYIFLEYFIIEPGILWDSILEILKQKAAEGVEVRILYDDVGTAFRLPWSYPATLEGFGIHCRVFNRMVPILSLRQNNRDHRKYAIADGKIAFTGGINLADEYINVNSRFGHWKDSVIRLEGEAVCSMTVSFLAMWSLVGGEQWSAVDYCPAPPESVASGYVQPYHDCPWDDKPVGQVVYLHLIHRAKRYVYITTPYLILDHALNRALMTAAESGVDVRIITPHIPDKKWVFEVTRSYYGELLRAGVRIFEYEPGFIHGKNMVADDLFGVVGTVNLDYRSMFLHFENGVVLYGKQLTAAVKEDFLNTQAKSLEILQAEWDQRDPIRRIFGKILRLFAPLM